VTAEEVFRRILGAVESAGIPYMLTGSYASSYHGVPRATQDIDLVIAPERAQLRGLALATAEDVVLAKLEWAKLGARARQVEDAAGILRARSAELDASYMERWVRELGIEKEWAAARRASLSATGELMGPHGSPQARAGAPGGRPRDRGGGPGPDRRWPCRPLRSG
jgi:hypothetical protein